MTGVREAADTAGEPSRTSLLNERRAKGLCSRCGEPLSEKEKALEGVGGSYVRCDKCVAALQRGEDV